MGEYNQFFTFTYSVQNLLFKDLTVSTKGAMFGLCLGVAFFTFLYEAVKSFRHYLVILQMQRDEDPSGSSDDGTNRESGLLSNSTNRTRVKKSGRLKFHLLQSLLHVMQLTLGYMVMLIVMSFNVWLIITVVITTAFCFYFHEYVLSRRSMILPVEIPGSSL